jgi:hypothetical protein
LGRALGRTLAILSWRARGRAVALALGRVLALLWGRAAVLTLSLRWVLSLLGRSAVLARRSAEAWRRLLSVALLTAVLAWGSAVATGRRVGLLVLGVGAAVDGTEEELDDPEIGRKIDRRVGAGHLFLFILVVWHYVSDRHWLSTLIWSSEGIRSSE